jgi:hypothetical protein
MAFRKKPSRSESFLRLPDGVLAKSPKPDTSAIVFTRLVFLQPFLQIAWFVLRPVVEI